jgi:hypothetical protein
LKTQIKLAVIFSTILSLEIVAQDFVIVKTPSDSLRELGDIKGAINECKKIYLTDSKDAANLYSIAANLSLDYQFDSAFKYIYLAANADTNIYFLTDPDFLRLRNDKRWEKFENQLIHMTELKYRMVLKDLTYAKKLWRMSALDQAFYSEIDVAEKRIGRESTVVSALWTLKDSINKKNQKDLELLLKQKGWPKISTVGNKASSAAFLIIQHSNISKQKEYLPVIKKLCEIKEAHWSSYALMYDRIQTIEGKPQRYGSQVRINSETGKYELFPLEDENKVDEWRKAIGMQALSIYVAKWGIKFETKR